MSRRSTLRAAFVPLMSVAIGGVLLLAASGCAARAPQPSGPTIVVSASPSATPTPRGPVVTQEQVDVTEPVPFARVIKEDATIAVGNQQITTKGVDGVKTRTFTVTKRDGVETDRVLVKESVTTKPVDEVTTVGTKAPPPPVQQAPVQQAPVQSEPYYKNCDAARAAGAAPIHRGEPGYRAALDRDGDGIACE